MSKEETVEVTIKVPKKLLDVLEAENFLGFDREYFFEAAIRAMIGCHEGTMDIEGLQNFRKKYGEKVAVFYISESMQ